MDDLGGPWERAGEPAAGTGGFGNELGLCNVSRHAGAFGNMLISAKFVMSASLYITASAGTRDWERGASSTVEVEANNVVRRM